MESSSAAVVVAGDGVVTNREEVSLLKAKNANPRPVENGWHNYEFMKNGEPRPSAVRDFPKGIVPIYLKQSAGHDHHSPSPEEERQLETPPPTSEGKVEQNQNEETESAFATEEMTKLNLAGPSQGPHSDLNPERDLNSKKGKHVQVENKRLSLASSSSAGKQSNGKDIKKKPQKTVEEKILADDSKVPTKAVQSAEKDTVSSKVSGSDDSQEADMVEDASVSKAQQCIEDNGSARASLVSDVSVQDGQATADMTEATTSMEKIPIKHSKLVDKKANVVLPELQGADQEEPAVSEAEKEAMDVEKPLRDVKAVKATEQSKRVQSVKRKSGILNLPETQGTKQKELNVSQSQLKTMDAEEEEKVQKAVEQKKKAQPAKRKSGVRDMPEPSSQVKNKVAKEGEHIAQDSQMEVSPAKTPDVGKEATEVGNDSNIADNAKLNSSGRKKKRPLEGPGSSVKGKKLKPSSEAQTPPKVKEKEPDSKSQGQAATPKRGRKSSTPSESSKRVRRSAGKSAGPAVTSTTDLKDARKSVLESLRLYDAVRRKFVQDEEKHGKQGRGSRADLQAATLLKDHNAVRSHEKGYGSLPGILVGDIFLFRTELSFARVHGPIQGGIEYLTTKDSEFNTPVAISIISNVGQDGEDNGEELIYTGQGGRSADNKQIADQKLERGNLAMDGSRKFKIPVRVLRGIKDVNSPTGKVYVYDGLYSVEETNTAKGSGGFDEFKFRLQRMPDQPELGSDTLKLAADLKSQAFSSRKDVVVVDISKGMESQAICVTNTVDDEQGPAEFEYSTKLIYPDGLTKLEPFVGCKCSGACTPSSSCSCFSRNGDESPYLNGGYLVRQKDFIFECGSGCSCTSGCRNRTPEKGPKFRLEVFKTSNRGWGVRALEIIPAGSFVCEYVGKVIAGEQDAKECGDRTHMLFTKWLPEATPRWGDVLSIIPDRSSSTVRPDAGKPELIIDASHVGNVARFINHSCSPNLFVQKVLSEHDDVRYPRFKLFAIDNILAMRELTFDYGYPSPDEGQGTEEIECLCGSMDCRRKLYA